MSFSGSPVLFYDVPVGGTWGKLGFGVPNWGIRKVTRNGTILDFVNVVGRELQAIMLTDDALSTRPPTINRIIDINKLIVAGRALLVSEAVKDNQPVMEGEKATNDVEAFLLYPTPIFRVRNRWMKRYAVLTMHALSEAIQSTENGTSPFEISNDFKDSVGQYFDRILQLVCTGLLRIDPSDPASGVPQNKYGFPDWSKFVLIESQIMSYSRKWFTSTERVDVCYPTGDIPSDFDLTTLTAGIPISEIPKLGPFPFAVEDSTVDGMVDDATLEQPSTSPNPVATGVAAATLAETQNVGEITGAPISRGGALAPPVTAAK
ncbi:MAG TPA: hypothetical protein VGX76_15130 [Pirellulales bacterium]|nr:hypothetical protein [Pirellulales bacterium]